MPTDDRWREMAEYWRGCAADADRAKWSLADRYDEARASALHEAKDLALAVAATWDAEPGTDPDARAFREGYKRGAEVTAERILGVAPSKHVGMWPPDEDGSRRNLPSREALDYARGVAREIRAATVQETIANARRLLTDRLPLKERDEVIAMLEIACGGGKTDAE